MTFETHKETFMKAHSGKNAVEMQTIKDSEALKLKFDAEALNEYDKKLGQWTNEKLVHLDETLNWLKEKVVNGDSSKAYELLESDIVNGRFTAQTIKEGVPEIDLGGHWAQLDEQHFAEKLANVAREEAGKEAVADLRRNEREEQEEEAEGSSMTWNLGTGTFTFLTSFGMTYIASEMVVELATQCGEALGGGAPWGSIAVKLGSKMAVMATIATVQYVSGEASREYQKKADKLNGPLDLEDKRYYENLAYLTERISWATNPARIQAAASTAIMLSNTWNWAAYQSGWMYLGFAASLFGGLHVVRAIRDSWKEGSVMPILDLRKLFYRINPQTIMTFLRICGLAYTLCTGVSMLGNVWKMFSDMPSFANPIFNISDYISTYTSFSFSSLIRNLTTSDGIIDLATKTIKVPTSTLGWIGNVFYVPARIMLSMLVPFLGVAMDGLNRTLSTSKGNTSSVIWQHVKDIYDVSALRNGIHGEVRKIQAECFTKLREFEIERQKRAPGQHSLFYSLENDLKETQALFEIYVELNNRDIDVHLQNPLLMQKMIEVILANHKSKSEKRELFAKLCLQMAELLDYY